MLNDKQKEILHHLWLVFGIIVAIIITLLGLWEFLLMIAAGLLFIYLFFLVLLQDRRLVEWGRHA